MVEDDDVVEEALVVEEDDDPPEVCPVPDDDVDAVVVVEATVVVVDAVVVVGSVVVVELDEVVELDDVDDEVDDVDVVEAVLVVPTVVEVVDELPVVDVVEAVVVDEGTVELLEEDVGVVVVAMATLLWPRSWDVSMAFLYRGGEGPDRGALASEVELLRDPALMSLEGEEGAGSVPVPKGRLSAEVLKDSHLVEVRYRTRDPELGLAVLEQVRRRYLASREAFQPADGRSEEHAFLQERREQAKQRLENAEQALQQRASRVGVPLVSSGTGNTLSTGKDLALRQLARLEGELADSEVAVKVAVKELETLGDQLDREPKRVASSSQEHMDPAVVKLKEEIAQLEIERDRLLQRFSRASVQVGTVVTRIELARTQLAQLQSNESLAGTVANPVHEKIRSEMQSAETRMQAASTRADALRLEVERERSELARLSRGSVEMERLERERQLALEEYSQLTRSVSALQIDQVVGSVPGLEVLTARAPRVSDAPVWPRPFLNLGLALLVGTLGGALITWLRGRADPTLLSAAQAERRFGVPVLVEIPESAGRR